MTNDPTFPLLASAWDQPSVLGPQFNYQAPGTGAGPGSSDPALAEVVKYCAPIWFNYLRGWTDEQRKWPDRGFRYSEDSGYQAPPINGVRNRLYELRWFYTFGWLFGCATDGLDRHISDATQSRAGTVNGQPVTYLSDAEIIWEQNRGLDDRLAMNTPPLEGYVEPPASVPRLGGATTPPQGGVTLANPANNDSLFFKIFLPYLAIKAWQASAAQSQSNPNAPKKTGIAALFG